MPDIPVENHGGIPKRPRKKGKIIVLCIIGALLLTAAVLVVLNSSVLRLAVSPDNIAVSGVEESVAVLKNLENDGSITNLEVSGDKNIVSFFNADKSIKITSEYEGGRFRSIVGEIDAERVHVSTVSEGRELAYVILSPYFSDDEIDAILLRYSPEIIANAENDNIDVSFDIGNSYNVTVTGSAYAIVEFGINAK